ncbi:hypothetical protein Taro_016583 [Colocasia esculenta]|uniref:Uncharacterized protein n=1 Tax=Colocasia esculenta TaxID=4460 RepID=A0A843UKR4_COLES|nr:hypothetical protein [Colocasia esculenta]
MVVLPKACRNPCASGAVAALRERNPGAGQEISESSPGPTGSECRLGIRASRAVPITGRGNIHVLPKWRVGIRAHREPLLPSGNEIRAPDRKSPSPAQGRPGRLADSELGPHRRFRSPGEEISTFYRSGAKSVY